MNKECCKRLNPAEWDKKEIVWRDKPFYKSRYRAFLHVPLNIGGKIREGMDLIEGVGFQAEPMVLSRNDTLWGADILIPVKQKTSAFKTELVTGRFLTRLFEGHFGDMRRWVKETKKYCKDMGMKAREFVFWYATCPKCAKKYGGKVQVVIFARVS